MKYKYNEGQVWSLIPARGGSKGIPRKNLLSVCGRPLITYSIAHSLECAPIDRTFVSTDDEEIATVAKEAGAEVPFMRPAEYATDEATDLVVFRHALTWFQNNWGSVPELLVHLRPTGPVRDSGVISSAVRQMLDCPKADALRSISLVLDTPYKMWTIEDERLIPLISLKGIQEAHSHPRQQLPPVYGQNGYVDVIRTRTILECNSMCGHFVLPLLTQGKIPDLDYPTQIPALISAVESHARSLEKPT